MTEQTAVRSVKKISADAANSNQTESPTLTNASQPYDGSLFDCASADSKAYPRLAINKSLVNNSVSCSFLSTAPYNGANTFR